MQRLIFKVEAALTTRTDENLLDQNFTNLLGNVLKHGKGRSGGYL